MSYDDAIEALSTDALKFVKDGFVVGLGSGRAATTLVKSLSSLIKTKNYKIKGVPTSLQIKLIAEKGGIPLVEADHVDHIDVVLMVLIRLILRDLSLKEVEELCYEKIFCLV